MFKISAILQSVTPSDRLLHGLHSLGDDLLVVLSQLSGVSDTEAMLEYLFDFLQCQSRHFWVSEPYQYITDTTYTSIEAKCTGRGKTVHHGQEGGGHDDVGAPAGACEKHCAHRAHFHWEEISAHP